VYNSATLDTEYITLTEIGLDTVIFRNAADSLYSSDTAGGSVDDGILLCGDSDVITLAYTDPDYPSDAGSDVATMVAIKYAALVAFDRADYSPDTAVIDSRAVLDKLHGLLVSERVHFALGETVTDVSKRDRCLYTASGKYSYGHVFNCAGANADRIARKFGLGRDYTLLPFKGLYYTLRPERENLVRSNIYPVPDISLPFLGVHLTRVISDDVYAGPTAIPAFGRENYGVLAGIRPGEGIKIGWQLARLYLRNQNNFRHLVHSEVERYRKTHFVEAVRRLVPDIRADDLVPSKKVGIRPQLINLRTQKLEMDFVIETTPSSVHVLNAISPAFTSAFAFSELLVDRYSSTSAIAHVA